jgi:hypothetical protein
MDLRRLRLGEWIAAISGFVLIASLFLPWETGADGGELNGWQSLAAVDVLLTALGVAAIAVWIVTATAKAPAPGVAAEALVTPFALVLSVICAFRASGIDGDGAKLALLGSVGVLAGVLVGMRSERLSRPGRPTDQTGVPLSEPLVVETLPGPPPA